MADIRFRRLAAAVLIMPVIGIVLVAAPASLAAAANITLTPAADAYVQSNKAADNFGTSSQLQADAAPVVNSYLRFPVEGLDAPPVKATLRIFSRSTGSLSARLWSVEDNAWTETGITYDNGPPLGAQLGLSGALTAGTWVSFDVTNQVVGNGPVSFAVTTGSTAVRIFDSREGEFPPELVVEPAPPPPPTDPVEDDQGNITQVAGADSYVQSDRAADNFGTSSQLQADASPVVNSYLRFPVQGLDAPPAKVTLRIFTRSTGSLSARLWSVADNDWTEDGITYNNAPPLGAQVGLSGALTAGTWVSFDVTNQVVGNGPVSFALTTGSTAVRIFDSREGENPPELVLEPAPPPTNDPVVAAAGDIACSPTEPDYNNGLGTPTACQMKATSDLVLDMGPRDVLMLGDAQYNSGDLEDFNASYDPTWGRFKNITRPAVGNHEYGQSGASGYFTYFGDSASPRQPGCTKHCDGWYSFDIEDWHVVVLNTECARINDGTGCAVGSPQEQWLAADLAANTARCTMAVQHRPRWSSNSFASPDVAPLIDQMYAHGVDVLLAGHAHSYERFAPQDPSGTRDDATGIRQFIVGTGGKGFSGFASTAPNSEVRKTGIFGVLKLTLHPASYDWSFVATPATPFSDSGTGTCH